MRPLRGDPGPSPDLPAPARGHRDGPRADGRRLPRRAAPWSSSSSSNSSSSSSNDKEALLPNPIAAFSEVVEQQGVAGLYAGALPRAVFAASLLALEFVIYDYLRALLKVSASDLQLTLDVLAGLN